MHELSLAAGIFDTIAANTQLRGKVSAVHVTIGPLSGVSGDALAFGFEFLAPEYGFTGAHLAVHDVAAQLRCDNCSTLYACDCFDTICPSCGAMARTVLSGSEFTLDSFELED
jgi:hydrogenase nickel incorporation protein HypA/HybF